MRRVEHRDLTALWPVRNTAIGSTHGQECPCHMSSDSHRLNRNSERSIIRPQAAVGCRRPSRTFVTRDGDFP